MDSKKGINSNGAGKRVALFAGSFDPFTIGHKSIVDRSLGLFDSVVIGLGVNTSKTPWMPLEERMAAIRRVYADQPRVVVESFPGLAADFARKIGARYLLRGVRSVTDFEYERNMADANRLITSGETDSEAGPLETVMLLSLPEFAVVSSSLVRELARFGAQYSQFIP